ncbi:MAG: hypothetical protein RBT80_27995, partial [Candidatus Vecturithrix sp.]|nr:hypothetical protein [Candidatus Vecturithrix sp.]
MREITWLYKIPLQNGDRFVNQNIKIRLKIGGKSSAFTRQSRALTLNYLCKRDNETFGGVL